MTDETSAKSPKWKIAIFVAVIILVVGIATYSLMSKNSTATAASNNNAAVANAGNTQANPGIAELTWVKSLQTRFTALNLDFAFVILSGNDDVTKKVADLVDETAIVIKGQGVNMDTMTLSSGDPELSVTIERLSIKQLPAVLAFNSSGSGAIIAGEITDTKLLQTFLTVMRACAPGASSGCCPSN